VTSRSIYTPVGAAPVQVYTPATVGTPHVVVYNNGPATVYLGGAGVTSTSGLALPPRTEVNFSNGVNAIYAAAGGVTVSGTATTNLTAAATGGLTSNISVGTTANFAAGNLVQVGTANTAEVGTIASIPDSTHLTLAAAVVYDHRAGATVATVTGASTGTVKTVAGTS
jgi:hypothetical protein